jgi:serine protease Do
MGLSFAIPIDIADNVRMQLVKNGRVVRSKIGVRIQPVSAGDAEAFGLDRPRGALVSEVEDGPAKSAGIRPGDIVLSVDGRPVEGNTALSTFISTMQPGTSTELEVWRDGKLRKMNLRVVERDPPGAVQTSLNTTPRRGGVEKQGAEQTALGLTVRPLTAEEREQVDTQGSLVIEDAQGAAAERLRPGDIIVAVGGAPVKTVAELQALIKSAPRSVALLIQRGDQQLYATLRKQDQ